MRRTVLFDLDGTLTDPGLGITNSVMYALSAMGREIPPRESLYPFIGPPLVDSFQSRCGMTAAEAEEALRLYREYFRRTGLYENEVYPAVPAMLETLRTAGFKAALATSKPEPFARKICDHFSLTPYLTEIVGSGLDGSLPRKADVILCATERLSVRAQDCVMVGDRLHDIEGAHERGIPAVGVLWGYGTEEELREAGADCIAPDTDTLLRILFHGKL